MTVEAGHDTIGADPAELTGHAGGGLALLSQESGSRRKRRRNSASSALPPFVNMQLLPTATVRVVSRKWWKFEGGVISG